MFYTYFILSLEFQYTLGYSFVLTVCAILGVNVINLVWAVLTKEMSKRKKKKSQKLYENRFAAYSKVDRYLYMMKIDRIMMEKKLLKIR